MFERVPNARLFLQGREIQQLLNSDPGIAVGECFESFFFLAVISI